MHADLLNQKETNLLVLMLNEVPLQLGCDAREAFIADNGNAWMRFEFLSSPLPPFFIVPDSRVAEVQQAVDANLSAPFRESAREYRDALARLTSRLRARHDEDYNAWRNFVDSTPAPDPRDRAVQESYIEKDNAFRARQEEAFECFREECLSGIDALYRKALPGMYAQSDGGLSYNAYIDALRTEAEAPGIRSMKDSEHTAPATTFGPGNR